MEAGKGSRRHKRTPNVAGHLARNGGFSFEPITAPQESSSGNSKGGDLSDEHASEEGGTGELKTEELKDSIIDLVLSARQREDVWREACPDARKHHEERCVKEAARMEELGRRSGEGLRASVLPQTNWRTLDSGQGTNSSPGLASSGRIGWLGGGRQR